MVMREREEPRPTYLLQRGAYDAPDTSEQLFPACPSFAAPARLRAEQGLGLALWLADPTHPLTARRGEPLLAADLGRGLVNTTRGFRRPGSPPSHLLLLDALPCNS